MTDQASTSESSSITFQLKELASRWFSPQYAATFVPAKILDSLIVYAFIQQIEGRAARLLREAYRRLQAGALTGDYVEVGEQVQF